MPQTLEKAKVRPGKMVSEDGSFPVGSVALPIPPPSEVVRRVAKRACGGRGEFSFAGRNAAVPCRVTRIPTAQTRSETAVTAAENFVPDALLKMRSNLDRYRHGPERCCRRRVSGRWAPRPRNLPPAAAGRSRAGVRSGGVRRRNEKTSAFKRVGVSGFRTFDFFGG